MLLALGGDALAVDLNAGLRLLNRSLHAADQLAHLARDSGLAVPEIALPALDSLLDLALGLGEHLRELFLQGLLGLCDRVPPRLGHRPLLLGQLRGGVGARARQDSLELSNSRPDLTVELGPKHRSTSLQLVLDPARSIEPDRHGDRSQRGAERGRRRHGADREIAARPEHDRDPAGQSENPDQDGEGDRDAPRAAGRPPPGRSRPDKRSVGR